jgi:zinc/manganese transport system ATP-binding protein
VIILEGKNIGLKVPQRWLYHDVNFTLSAGEALAVVGDNGVGKTTLIQALLGQRQLDEGTVVWPNGPAVVAYVPQYRADIQQFSLTIRDFISLSFNQGLWPFLTPAEKQAREEVLQLTHLQSIADRSIDTASGGERQRAYLAQALLQQPDILILDEATANLDNVAKHQLMQVLTTYRQTHELAVMMVSHDLPLIQTYSENVLHIRPDGSVSAPVAEMDWARLEAEVVHV